jgi:ABC-type nitrate/sulfonate/bicarbonate transport system permease component
VTTAARLRGDALGLARRVNVSGILVFVAALALWELAIRAGLITVDFMSAPTDIAGALWDITRSGALWDNTAHTLRSVMLGWLVAAGGGVLIGMLLGLWRPAWVYSLASIDFLRSLPSIALVPVAVLIFGFSLKMELMVIVYAAIWPVIINTIGGIRQVPAELRDVARTYRLSRLEEAWKIVLPAAAPTIVVSLRLAMAISLIVAVVAEMIGNPAGLGYAMVFQQQAIQPDAMFAYIITIGILGVILNTVLVSITRMLRPVYVRERAAR